MGLLSKMELSKINECLRAMRSLSIMKPWIPAKDIHVRHSMTFAGI